jgi:putative heme-binding domain-containing protein
VRAVGRSSERGPSLRAGHRRALVAVAVAAAILLLVPGPLAGQGHETAADIEEGGRVFRNACANCHGPDGNEVAGIDLGRGQFRRASSDADLNRIIRTGVPNTPMPPSNMSEEQAARVVGYLRSLAASRGSAVATGDAVRGKLVFGGNGRCATCHRVDGVGARLGPDLSRIGQMRRGVELEQALVDPQADIAPTNRSYRVVTPDGVVVTGRLLNHDSFTVQILDATEQLRSFEKASLREHGFAPSPMPSFRNTLSAQELADVVGYLVSLKGRSRP